MFVSYTLIAFISTLPFLAYSAPIPVPWDGGDASSLAGQAQGGSVYREGGISLVELFSHNAASGGKAVGGPAIGGNGGDRISKGKSTGAGSAGGDAHSQGGLAPGGSVFGGPALSLISIGSGNAGEGGDASSSLAKGGDAGNIVQT